VSSHVEKKEGNGVIKERGKESQKGRYDKEYERGMT